MQNLKSDCGQGLVEYILVVVVMAILAIGVVQKLANIDPKRVYESQQQPRSGVSGLR